MKKYLLIFMQTCSKLMKQQNACVINNEFPASHRNLLAESYCYFCPLPELLIVINIPLDVITQF